MAGSIFDGSFQTALPETSGPLNLMAAALAARQKALDPTSIFSGLKSAGKVFTDMESELKKSNTALLQRHLDAMSPSQIEQMVANGVDPVKEAFLAGVPINGADTELNKAWDTDITDAGTQLANRWVATVLPTLSHEARMELMSSNDPAVWTKYGLSSFARISPDVQQQIKTALQDAATAELRYRTAQLDPNSLVAEGKTPVAKITEDLNKTIMDNANWNDPTLTGELGKFYDAGKAIYTDQSTLAGTTSNTERMPGGVYGAKESDTVNTQFDRQYKAFSEGVVPYMNDRGQIPPQDVITEYIKDMKGAQHEDGTPIYNWSDAQWQEAETKLRRQYGDISQTKVNEGKEHSYNPSYELHRYIKPTDLSSAYDTLTELESRGDSRAPTYKQNMQDSLDYLWMENLLPAMQKYVKNNKIDVKQFKLLADQWRRNTQRPDRRKGNPGLLRMSDDSFERVVKKLESYADNFSALLSDQQKLKIDRSRYELLGTSTVYANILNSKSKTVPKHIQQLLNSENLDLAAQRLLNTEDYKVYQGTDELTRACIVWEALSTYKAELGIKDKSNEELLKDIDKLGTLHNARFSTQLKLAADADLPNRYDSRNLEQNSTDEVKKRTQQ